MPKIVNGEKRRQRIAEAVWDIAAEQGLDQATIRAVAATCGLSVGAVQHSFRTQDDLKQFAMELVVKRVTERLEHAAIEWQPDAQEAIISLLLETLPLDADREREARIWAAFSAAALFDTNLGSYSQQMNTMLTKFCCRCAEQLGVVAPDLAGLHLHALLDGLTLALLVDTSPDKREQAVSCLRQYVQKIAE